MVISREKSTERHTSQVQVTNASRELIRVRLYTQRTEQAYVHWIKQFRSSATAIIPIEL